MIYLLIRLSEQTLQAQQHGLHVVDGAPLVLEDVEADAAAKIDVGMVYGCLEEDCGSRVGIVWWEGERELERQARVRCLCWADDSGGPVHQVAIGIGEGGDAGRGRHH